ncbi:hypothetical protein KUC73_09525 [Pseudomonas aeruginosa]|uniref:hypothetical protein n=1 Tax=Pseudomonas aeruginosa TaxID=287 RepID=UPI0021E0FD44|nr:hypothetical protein [Pseudomonas aeruginosa]MCV0190197.1 hypothetical protein [Pseudomonas aeruginosa]
MSEVKRFDVPSMRSLTKGEQAVMGYEVVLASDYDALAAEAQALREEVARAEQHRNDQADLIVSLRTEVAALRMARDDFKLERDLARKNFCDEQAANYQLKAHLNTCLDELSELRARVAVVPERKLLNAGVPGLNRNSGWNACLDELARINGMTVSEELLRRLGQVISWQCFGDCRAFSDQRIPEPSEVIEELRALLNEDKENGNG